jgi:hypothetical protein
MLIARGALKCAKLEKIYRQKDNPIEDFHAQKPEEALNKLELSGSIRESDTHTDARGLTVSPSRKWTSGRSDTTETRDKRRPSSSAKFSVQGK